MDEKNLYTSYELTLVLMTMARKAGYQNAVTPQALALCEQYLSKTDQGRARLKRLNSRIATFIMGVVTNKAAPGVMPWLLTRKIYIEKKARAFLAKHPDGQMVNIGAGLDTLLSRLADDYSSHAFIELDYPVVADLKRSTTQAGNITFYGCDLSESSVEQALSNTPFNNEKPTFFLMEGLLMYLPKEVVTDLLTQLITLTSGDKALLFSAMDDSITHARWMKRHNSKWEWSSNPKVLKTELSSLGITTSEQLGHLDMHNQHAQQLPQPKHFYQDEYYNYAEV
jgi:O-methyltransferase involved in polyketide biosynthesis